jgi:hypothetical protein
MKASDRNVLLRTSVRMSQALSAAVRVSVSAVAPREADGDEAEHADDDDRDPYPPQRAPPVAGEPDGEREPSDREDRQ